MSGQKANTRAIVIGAGIGGLAIAARLAAQGFGVKVFDANGTPGGKASEFTDKGYRFDAGPSLFTMPQWLDEIFEACGKNPRDYYSYQKLNETCRYFYPDGTRFTADSNPEKFAELLATIGKDDKATILEYLKHSAWLYEITRDVFLRRSLHKASSYLHADVLRGLSAMPALGAFSSMNGKHERQFKDTRWVQLFNRYATYNGSNPYKAPATLSVIPHLEYGIGAFYPAGGIHSIPKALHSLGLDLGVEFHFNQKVDRILTERSRVSGVEIEAERHESEVVVSNSDVYTTYQNLIADQPKAAKVLKQERSNSALIFYWGIKKSFSSLGLHNIFFSSDYRREFKHLFERKEIVDDPTVYINITSKIEPSDAPEGGENWFVMINAPAVTGQAWDAMIESARRNILAKLNSELGEDIEPLIEGERILSPPLIESRTGSYAGSLYGTSSNGRLAAFLRHPNFSRKYKGLYFVGGSVHPGGGIPLVLCSAGIVANLLHSKS